MLLPHFRFLLLPFAFCLIRVHLRLIIVMFAFVWGVV
jgi:hypothetical protein